ncbi:MAG: hypothetical protein RIR41_3966 [Pseudomonadota bacterium]
MKITYAKNRLRDAIDSAPPMMAATAIKQAEALLGEMEQECLARLDVLVAAFPHGLSGDEDARSAQMREVYDTSRRMIGVATVAGIPEMDIAARSLCEVADALLVRQKTDWEPLRVHISTMHLLRRSDIPDPAKGQLLVALESLRTKIAPATASQRR